MRISNYLLPLMISAMLVYNMIQKAVRRIRIRCSGRRWQPCTKWNTAHQLVEPCQEVQLVPTRVIGAALLSMVEESSPSAPAMEGEEDGYDIQELANIRYLFHVANRGTANKSDAITITITITKEGSESTRLKEGSRGSKRAHNFLCCHGVCCVGIKPITVRRFQNTKPLLGLSVPWQNICLTTHRYRSFPMNEIVTLPLPKYYR